jgi:MYXO-CTERM domain-containing protein
MYRVHVLLGVLVLAASSFAQQPDTARNPNYDATRDAYNRPVDGTTGAGNWGLLGLLGLSGLLGLRRRETIGQGREDVRGREEFVGEQRRRAS